MRVLIACEFSGVVRDAFLKAGHDALSCDLLESSSAGPHYRGDVRALLRDPFDMMIAFPPCTFLAVSGARYFAGRRREQLEALEFVRELLAAPFRYIALENPIGIISSQIRKPEQIIQPYHFGHDASKATCLWLKNLPPLLPTRYIKPRIVRGARRWNNQTDGGQNKLPPAPDRAARRSITYQGIAQAMAQQWSAVIRS